MGKRAVAVVLVASSLALVAGKKSKEPPPEVALAPAAVPDLYLRSGFDKDPSSYVGRFVPDGVVDVDESVAMPMPCSQHVTWKEVDAGGVQYSEMFNVSTAVSARIGIPLVAGISGGHSQSKAVKVKYALTKKMVAQIADPAAFQACCKAADDQCTGRYISEFYEGNGEVFYAYDSGTGGKGQGSYNLAVGEVVVENGVSWAKSITFPNPVYFAFKTTPVAGVGGHAPCGAWTSAVPKSTGGNFFVGVSDPRSTEAASREAALADARAQTVRWAGTAISEGTMTIASATGDRAALSERLDDTRVLETAAQGVARLVKDESWCVTTEDTPDGKVYTAKVLAFLPKESEGAAAQAIVDAAKP